MKIIRVDNFDRGIYPPVLVEDNLTEMEAIIKASNMNSREDDMSENYYMVVEDDYEIDPDWRC